MLSLALIVAVTAPASIFYLSANGNDENDGLSTAKGWKTLAKVNSTHLAPGSEVLLEGGQMFPGHLGLEFGGTQNSPIKIASWGHGRAAIQSEGSAITVSAGGIVIRDLILNGSAGGALKDQDGLKFVARGSSGEKYEHVEISDVEISGFGGSGISFGSDDDSLPGFKHVRIRNVFSHDNFGSGISTYGKTDPRIKGYAHEDFVILDCECSHNASGTGMVIGGVNGCEVARCCAFGNHGAGGGVGIWAWGSKNVRFRECIAADTKTDDGDGGGFDLDGGCVDCRVERCLAYDNGGPGYMHCDYPGAPATYGNEIVSSVSVNDGRKAKGDNVGLGYVTWGSGLDHCSIKNNLVMVSEKGLGQGPEPIFFVSYVKGCGQEGDVLHVRDCSFESNTLLLLAPGFSIIDLDAPTPDTTVRFSGNRYRVLEGVTPLFMSGDAKKFPSLAHWQMDSGSESRDQESPLDPKSLNGLEHYRIRKPSELPAFFRALGKVVD